MLLTVDECVGNIWELQEALEGNTTTNLPPLSSPSLLSLSFLLCAVVLCSQTANTLKINSAYEKGSKKFEQYPAPIFTPTRPADR